MFTAGYIDFIKSHKFWPAIEKPVIAALNQDLPLCDFVISIKNNIKTTKYPLMRVNIPFRFWIFSGLLTLTIIGY